MYRQASASEEKEVLMTNRSKRRQTMLVLLMLAVIFSFMPVVGNTVHAASKNQNKAVKAPGSLKIKKDNKKRTVSVSWKTEKKSDKVQIQIRKGSARYRTVKTTSLKKTVLKNFQYNINYRLRLRAVRVNKHTRKYSRYAMYKSTIRFSKKEVSGGEKTNTTTNPESPALSGSAQNQSGEGVSGGDSSENAEGQGSTSGSASQTPSETEVSADVLKNEQTKLLDLGFSQYVIFSFQRGYSLNNTRIFIDGTDITDAATPVTDDGSIAKWEITSLNPGEITAASKEAPDKKESVKLSDNKNPKKPVVRKHTSADYMIAHGPVSAFDYYLTNYDDNGNSRVEPSKTTFGADDAVPADNIKYFVSEAELKNDGTGKIVILFNYGTEKEKNWFNGIAETGSLALVEGSENKTTLNDHLEYSKSTEDHYGKMTGAITIKLPQSNFKTNGRYLIRVKSSGSQTCLASVNLVNEEVPGIKISENGSIESGRNIHFHISNMVTGLKDPIERVTLTNPKGESEELENISDYFLYGNSGLFVLYNDVNAKDGTNHTEYSGKYTLTIEAAGFKTIRKSFEVTGGKYSGGKRAASRYKVDAVTRATSIGGGSSSGSSSGSSGTSVSADLKFDTDLLVNALIMDKISRNKAAKAIADRWLTQIIADYACTADGQKFADWTDYYDAVQSAKEEGRYLSYADYLASGKAKLSDARPSKVKSVLEDNLLGDIDESYIGLRAPELFISGNVKEGQDAVFTCKDTDYLKAVVSLYEKGNYYSLNEDKYSVNPGKGTLTIRASVLSLDSDKNMKDNVFTIKAKGYKDQDVHVTCEKVLENVALTLQNTDIKSGEDAVISIEGSDGDFLKYLTGVTLIKNGKEKNLYTSSAGGTSGNDWYEISKDRKTLMIKGGAFKEAGEYKLVLKASHYENQAVTFTVHEKPDADNAQEAPEVKSAEKVGTLIGTPYILVNFNGDSSDAAEYLKHLTSVEVGGISYSRGLLGISDNQYRTDNDPVYGGLDSMLKLSANGFSGDQDTEVVLRADGYKTLHFMVGKNGNLINSKSLNALSSGV